MFVCDYVKQFSVCMYVCMSVSTQIFFHWTPTKYGSEQDFSICIWCVLHVCNVEEVIEAEEGRAASRESNRKQSSTATSKAQMQLQKEIEKEKKFRTAAAYRERRNTIAEPERLRRQALSHCMYVCMLCIYVCTCKDVLYFFLCMLTYVTKYVIAIVVYNVYFIYLYVWLYSVKSWWCWRREWSSLNWFASLARDIPCIADGGPSMGQR